jgi:hypothetical protein
MLPMMFMEDAIRATIEIMSVELNCLSISSSYNLAGLSFTPKQIFDVIKSYFPNFEVVYEPDYRQAIADSWPESIDDSVAQFDFKWKSKFDLQMLCEKMIENLKK